MNEEIALGDIARDDLTGFEGLVVGRTRWLSNCDRLALQPRALDKDGQPQKTNSFDITHCRLVTKGAVVPSSHDWERKEHIALGDTCKDEITGFEGVVTARTSWFASADSLVLQPKGLNKDGQPHATNAFEMSRLSLVSKLQPPAPKEHRGGPMDDVQRSPDPAR